MARTTTTSSKSKTKSQKKTTTKAAKSSTKTASTARSAQASKAVAAKVAPKSAVAPVVSEVKPAPRTARRGLNLKRGNGVVSVASVRKLHALSAIVFAVLAAAVAVMMAKFVVTLNVAHMTKDGLLTAVEGKTVLAPAQHALMDIDIRWCVVGLLVVSAAFSLVRMRQLRSSDSLAVRVQPLRWLDAAVSAALMVGIVSMFTGSQEVVSIKLLGWVAVAGIVFAWIAERENANSEKFVRFSYVASLVSGAVVLLALAVYADMTVVYGIVRSPWFVYVLDGIVFVSAIVLGLLQRNALQRRGAASSYAVVEQRYAYLNLIAKVAFAVAVVAGLHVSLK